MNLPVILTISLIVLVVILIYISNQLILLNRLDKLKTGNINIENNTIDFDSLTLKQKIAQMFVIKGDSFSERYTNLNVGGIYFDKANSPEDYKKKISEWQLNSRVKLFVSADLEGAWSPFSESFGEEYVFPKFSEIKTKEEAYGVGLDHGETLKRLGFTLNFAPVAEFYDNAYGGRVFSGKKEVIKEKLIEYIKGLQKNVLGTCKHYPGKGMIKNTHYIRDKQTITKEDLELFEICFKSNISSVMIGHQIVEGELNSNGKPASVSKEVIESVPEDILVISDGLKMAGIRSFYSTKIKMYADLINSGENLILDWPMSPITLYKAVTDIEKKVRRGEISEEKINKSVRKILKVKGYNIEN